MYCLMKLFTTPKTIVFFCTSFSTLARCFVSIYFLENTSEYGWYRCCYMQMIYFDVSEVRTWCCAEWNCKLFTSKSNGAVLSGNCSSLMLLSTWFISVITFQGFTRFCSNFCCRKLNFFLNKRKNASFFWTTRLPTVTLHDEWSQDPLYPWEN